MLLAGRPRFCLGDSIGLIISLTVGLAIGSAGLIVGEVVLGLLR